MSSEEEVTVLLFMTAKAGREDECRELTAKLAESTRAEDEGCINYVFHQRADNAREFVLYERWRDQAAIGAHLARLQAVYGPPAPGEGPFPAALGEPFEKSEVVALSVVA